MVSCYLTHCLKLKNEVNSIILLILSSTLRIIEFQIPTLVSENQGSILGSVFINNSKKIVLKKFSMIFYKIKIYLKT